MPQEAPMRTEREKANVRTGPENLSVRITEPENANLEATKLENSRVRASNLPMFESRNNGRKRPKGRDPVSSTDIPLTLE